jgi:uncharacterized protein YndB with AHSA1/START domain
MSICGGPVRPDDDEDPMRADVELEMLAESAGIGARATLPADGGAFGSGRTGRRRGPRRTVVRVARNFRASAARVFGAWLDAGSAGLWLFATASQPIEAVEIDPRVGGAFRLVERRHGRITEHTGRYLEIAPPRRIVFTLSIEARTLDVTRVAIDIVSRPTGCRLVLAHENVPAEAAEHTRGRWIGILYGLDVTLEEAPFKDASNKE